MQGNDSLLGSMLEKAGIDADKVRETIQNAFQKVKDFLITTWGVIKTVLTAVWNALKTVATSVFGGLQRFWEKHGEQIMTALCKHLDRHQRPPDLGVEHHQDCGDGRFWSAQEVLGHMGQSQS